MQRIFCALASTAALAAAHAQSVPTVTWYANSFPPYMMVGGAEDGQGAFDQARRMMAQSMPEFRHKQVDAALPRTIESIKTEADACSPSLIPTPERRAIMAFSVPFMQLLPNAVVTLRKHLPLFQPFLNDNGEVRLDSALASGKVRIGLAPDRSYGAAIDPIIKKHAATVVVVQAKDQFSSRLLKLAYQNEYDAIIGYAVELKYTVKQQKMKQDDFAVLPIAEATDLLPVAVGCSKTEQGTRIVAGIDRAISEHRREMDDLYRHLLDSESLAYYDRQLQKLRTAK